jgi:hypothetical protein
MLSEIHSNINYLKDFERVTALSVFDFLCVCLESQKMHLTPTNNCTCPFVQTIFQSNYVTITFDNINDFNLVDLFHH